MKLIPILFLAFIVGCTSSQEEKTTAPESAVNTREETNEPVVETLLDTTATGDTTMAFTYPKALSEKENAAIRVGSKGFANEIVVPENTWLALTNNHPNSSKEIALWESLGTLLQQYKKQESDTAKHKEAASVYLMCTYSTEPEAFEQLEFNSLSKGEVQELIQNYSNGNAN